MSDEVKNETRENRIEQVVEILKSLSEEERELVFEKFSQHCFYEDQTRNPAAK